MRLLAVGLAALSAALLLWAVARLLSDDDSIGRPPRPTVDELVDEAFSIPSDPRVDGFPW